jgi:electron transport complex protein RnfB
VSDDAPTTAGADANAGAEAAATADAPADASTRAAALDALLPQTQCTRCGYPACRPYAEAIARGDADINQCPPGGETTIAALARLLGRAEKPLNPQNGVATPPRVALIDEARCIGCAKCLPACPVDAIVGAQKFMHTVIAGQCTGCELCLPPCPVDCISMVPLRDANGAAQPGWSPVQLTELARANRRRFEAHVARRDRVRAERDRAIEARKRQAAGWRRTESQS